MDLPLGDFDEESSIGHKTQEIVAFKEDMTEMDPYKYVVGKYDTNIKYDTIELAKTVFCDDSSYSTYTVSGARKLLENMTHNVKTVFL